MCLDATVCFARGAMGEAMLDWWPSIGEASVLAGSGLGLTWSIVSTLLRRRKYAAAGRPSFGQVRWFVLSFLSMGSFVALGTALGLASLQGLLPPALFWFLLGLGVVAFGSALLFPSMEIPLRLPHELAAREPPADPPILPVRKSA